MNKDLKSNYKWPFIIVCGILLLGIVFIFLYIRSQSSQTKTLNPSEDTNDTLSDDKEINKINKLEDNTDNYEINYLQFINPTISGKAANQYINNAVTNFKTSAMSDKAEIVAEFSELPDWAQRPYVLIINPENNTQVMNIDSSVIIEYQYTGGANGNSFYKSFNFRNDKPINLANIVTDSDEFMNLVRNKLREYDNKVSSDGSIFLVDLNDINFTDLNNWSFATNKDMIIYFDEYQITPGAVGSFKINIPYTDLSNIINI